MDQLGRHISAAAGKSAQIELKTITTKLGGNAPIMSNALAQLGVSNYCVGTMGFPKIQDVFQQMHERCILLSVGEPGMTNALEFDDGKLILSELNSFDKLDLSYIFQLKGNDFLDECLENSQLIAMVDWTNLPLCTQLWESMRQHLLRKELKNKIYFFDLCDPSKKTSREIAEVLQVISRYAPMGKVILGLNENEAVKVYMALQQSNSAGHEKSLEEITQFIFDRMDINALLVHPVDCSLLATSNGMIRQQGKLITHPKILTGGGDNLNAGFCFGLMNEYDWGECMLLGMAVSGAYVQNGFSPSIDDVLEFISDDHLVHQQIN